MSKLKGKHGNCSVLGCKDQHRSLHRPPAQEDRRAEWLKFIFDGTIPATLCKNLYVCANHFGSDCFTNLGQYKAGLATKLCLKEGSVPSTRGRAAEEGHEALGETMGGDGDGGSARLCPLCQQAQADRDALSLHLTEKHSVLPACVNKLLDIAPPAQRFDDECGENGSENKINGKSLENTKSPSLASQDEGDSCSQDGSTLDKEACEETEADWGGTESDQENVAQTEAPLSGEMSSDRSSGNRPFKCHACLEFFPTRSALSVHYNSTSHIQRMRSGAANDKDPSGPARPYVSNKPYQCAVCRVSYNHAITLESHLKSVLHQSRSRNAGTNPTPSAGGGNVGATSNGAVQPSASPSQAVTKDNEQVPAPPSSPLLSSPVASAQAVSAFLTLLTSSPNSVPHSILPSLFTAGTGPAPAATPAQIISQPQMLMPLILNGLQAQSPSSESPKQVLPQAVPVLGLNAAQQALLAQGLSGLQNQWAAFRLSNASQAMSDESMLDKVIKSEIKQEPSDRQVSETAEEDETGDGGVADLVFKQKCVHLKRENHPEQDKSVEVDGQGAAEVGSLEESGSQSSEDLSECSSLSHKNNTESKPSPTKGPNTKLALASSREKRAKSLPRLASGPPVLTEFQSQVLWAFFESRNEADSASPPREDCEALGREVGLTEEEVRTWLLEARRARDRRIAEETDEYDEGEESMEDEEGALMIDEGEYVDSPSATSSHAMDLSSSADRGQDKPFNQELCLTSDSENEEFYTSVIVTDEESQSSSVKEEQPASPAKPAVLVETSGEKSSGGGKVLRSTTVFLSDAEEDDDDQTARSKKRKRETEKDESECKKERQDADLDVQLEAQADPPTPLSVTLDPQGLPAGLLHPLPLSLSLAPFSTQLFSPYVLSVPSSVVGVGVSDADRAKVATFASPAAVTRTQGAAIAQTAQILSNGNDCDSVLDLSMGKNTATSTPVSATSKSFIQKTALLDGLGLRPTTVGVPADGSLIVVQVKPDSAITLPKAAGTLANCNNLAKASAVYMRAAEKVNASLMARERESEQDKARDLKRPNARRFRDMRRSRTIIQADQLDILYGCYFKDPNPGKHEFEQISEWVQLPKKVVQIWFQNMRARERKGEVRFISDGTLAAVGKPLIKFTWPLKKPIFSSTPKANSSPSAPSWVPSKPQPGTDPPKVTQKVPEVKEPLKIPIQCLTRPKEVAATVVGGTSAQKTKVEAVNAYTMVKIAPKTVAPLVPVPILTSASVVPQITQKTSSDDQTESDDKDREKGGPGTTNRMVPKMSTTPINKSPAVVPQKHNGITYWSQKGPIKINTLSREQLGLSTPRPIVTAASLVTSSVPASAPPSDQSQKEAGYIQQHSTPRRPRTHLNCLQLSILQSCYETCAHPNALECEAVGTELGLPLKVVQIWFQNTRAKEKRWRLQQEKLSPNSSDPSKKVDISSGTYLQYNALRANRPILPKPVQLTVLETSTPSPVGGQPATRETLRGKCEVCGVEFESRAAARDHVFAPAHLAKLRTSNFGQAATQLNNGSAMATASVSPASGTS